MDSRQRARNPGLLAALVVVFCAIGIPGRIYDAEEILGEGVGRTAKVSSPAVKRTVEAIASQMRPGDALRLSAAHSVGSLDLTGVPDGVEISGQGADTIYLGGVHSGLVIWDTDALVVAGRPGDGFGKAGNGSRIESSTLFKTSGLKGAFTNAKILVVQSFGQNAVNVTELKNCVVLYCNIHGQPGGTGPIMTVSGADNSRIYHLVQANYCTSGPEVIIGNSTNLTLLGGDSEGSKGTTFYFKDCTNLIWAAHRVFHSHGNSHGCTGGARSIDVSGGNGVKFFQSQDIGDPTDLSLRVTGTADFQIWGGFWENPVEVPAEALLVFHTPDGFNGQPVTKWAEPVYAGNEVPLRHMGKDFTQQSVARSNEFPVPPSIPPAGMDGSMGKVRGLPRLRYLESATFGAEVLAAGADPTGRRASDRALAKVLAETGRLDIPEGTFLLSSPLVVGATTAEGFAKAGGDVSVSGRGEGRTVLVASGDHHAVIRIAGMTRRAAEVPAKGTDIHDITLQGGSIGIDYRQDYVPSINIYNVTMQGQTLAGVKCGTIETDCAMPPALAGSGGTEYDQVKYMNCTFDGQGVARYGWHNNATMIDKHFFYNCRFTNIKDAGICANFSNIEQTSVIECTFENIAGPGVDYFTAQFGGPNHICDGYGFSPFPNSGYTPAMCVIESCRFTECGSETRPAIDFSWTESGIIANSTITIRNKSWKWGFLGSANGMTDVTVDVDMSRMVAGGAAVALRQNYNARNSRTGGNILKNVKATGPVTYINDNAASYIAGIKTNIAAFPSGPAWEPWKTFEERPWCYANLFYNCEFIDPNGAVQKYGYVVVETDRTGLYLQQVVLKGEPVKIFRSVSAVGAATAPAPWHFYDMSGRLVREYRGSTASDGALTGLPAGTYVARREGVKGMKFLPIVR